MYGMASQGSLPKFLALVHKKRKTPFYAIFVVMAFSTAFLFIEKIDVLAGATGLGALVVFSLVNTSLIKLRFSKPKLARPFKVPLNVHNFPLPTFLGLLFSMILMLKFEFEAISIVLVILTSGLFVFYLAKKLRSSRGAQKLKSLKT